MQDTSLKDDEIEEYVNQAVTESVVNYCEESILAILRDSFEKYPTEENSKKWLDYTDWVIRRRLEK